MDENKRLNKNRLSDQLPSHSPNPGSWQLITSKLDAMDAEVAFQEKLVQLPVHTPDQGIWIIIQSRLNRIAYYKTSLRIAMAAAAGLLIFFTVTRFSDYNQNSSTAPQIAIHEKMNIPPAINLPGIISAQTPPKLEINSTTVKAKSDKYNLPTNHTDQNIMLSQNEPDLADYDAEIVLETNAPEPGNIDDMAAQATSGTEIKIPPMEILGADDAAKTSVLQYDPVNPTITTPVKYYTPKDPKTGNGNNHFALAMDYLPENINNGTNNSLFHNVDLTASYNKEKVRFNTSVGMAYNEQQLEFDMNYDINTPVMGVGPGGEIDTVRYDIASMESQYQGTEKHQYFTYNLGFGRRIFNFGRFSSWINAGAGFGIRLNNPDLIADTEKSIKGRYNAQITSVNASKPVYNDINVNFVTGIDFSYEIFKRLSFTFTPTSRWYFKPVLTKDNRATDELTLGFKTGMKFEF